jgi:hypothetical protein
MKTDKIEKLIVELSERPFDPLLNFNVASEYERLAQKASAVSFYMRTAEYGEYQDSELIYASLIRIAKCFNDQKERIHTVQHCLMQAVAVMPERPEAYFLLAQYHEQLGNWQDCYTYAEMGLYHESKILKKKLEMDLGYPGRYVLEFEKAVSGWWLGKADQSHEIFIALLANTEVNEEYKKAVRSNLATIWKE